MKYGYFDQTRREYVIDRIDVPVSWTNYLGVKDLCGVFNHTAGGYLFYKSPEYHRITRFRPNGVPADRPGHYVYVRDEESGDYWTLSWQPAGKPLGDGPGAARYTCRHGLSYSTYHCEYGGISGEQTLFIPLDDPVEIWDVKLRNDSDKPRRLSVFGYAEFSFHHIQIDNQNFQMSLYSSGSSHEDGVIEVDLFYEDGGFQYFTVHGGRGGVHPEDPAFFDCLRDAFIGPYRTESNPLALERGSCSGSAELGGNHCGALRRIVELKPGEEERLVFLLGEGNRAAGKAMRAKYGGFSALDGAFRALGDFWTEKLGRLQVSTPNEGMNAMLNVWNLYQAEINVMFSRFASFIEVGGRTGLGYRDTAQDAMMTPHSNPEKCKERILQLLRGLTSAGYGLHLFSPEWFEKRDKPAFTSPTVVPPPPASQRIHGLADACADDALWLVPSVVEYIRETGDLDFAAETCPYADTFDPETGGGMTESVYDHLKRILDFSAEQTGPRGICRGLRADWNDCLNLGGGESAMVSFLHHWALGHFRALARRLGRRDDAEKYDALAAKVREACERELWNGEWYTRGFTASGRPIGSPDCAEGRIFMESNTWAVLSLAAPPDRGRAAMDAVDRFLYTPWGLKLCDPAFSRPDDEVGFVTRVYKGLKENAAIFSHPNPWAWAAEAILGRGDRAMKFYDALCPFNQNDRIEVRRAEPYVYCQFIAGPDHSAFGRAHHPFMTGSAGWSYFAATRYILGVRPGFDDLTIDPCIPPSWPGFRIRRIWRGALYDITVENPRGVSKGVKECTLNGAPLPGGETGAALPARPAGSENRVTVLLGRRD
ncbi:MAG: N,N'-diacetylchitobiose phosphorylase [Treponema sp.]|jgi:N,N'-diacetylchitobiose phosphorylase|nr:N,N'-diacetylchitobiose phosphorylase [Treponema sp.]